MRTPAALVGTEGSLFCDDFSPRGWNCCGYIQLDLEVQDIAQVPRVSSHRGSVGGGLSFASCSDWLPSWFQPT